MCIRDSSITGGHSNASWFNELYKYTGWNNAGPINGQLPQLAYATATSYDSAINYLLGSESGHYKEADRLARDHEVWFLDMGKHRHRHANTDELNWFNIPGESSTINDAAAASSTPMSGGSVDNSSSRWHHFKLTLGPILRNKALSGWAYSSQNPISDTTDDGNDIVTDFWNVGTGLSLIHI